MRFLVQAKNKGANALTLDVFREAFQLVEEVQLLDAGGVKYSDICMRSLKGGCVYSGPLRFFNTNATQFESQASTDLELLAALSSTTYGDTGESVQRNAMFGQLKMDSGSQTLVSAPVWLMDFVLRGGLDRDTTKKWEKEVIDNFVSDSYEEVDQKWKHIHVELFSMGRSLDDELARSVSGDMSFISMAFAFLSMMCALMLGHPLRGVQGRRLLGGCDFLLVILGTIAGYGLASAGGVPFTSLQQILPFILVGIGIDDAFIIVSAFDRTDTSKPVEERVRDAMLLEGMSITLTSVTDIIAFLCGSTASFPAVSSFCVYAGLSLMFVYGFHVTAFCSMLALDARRQAASRCDVLCCVKLPQQAGEIEGEAGSESFSERMMVSYTKAITSSTFVKLALIAIFLTFTGVCLWQAIDKTDTDFNVIDLTPDKSYMRAYLDAEVGYWGVQSAGSVELHLRGLNESDAGVQAEIRKAEDEMLQLQVVNTEEGIKSWHRSFTAWARENKGRGPEGMLTAGEFRSVDGDEYLNGPGFNTALQYWLNDCNLGCRFSDDVMWEGGEVRNSRMHVRQMSLAKADDQADALTEVENFYQEKQKVLPGIIMHSPAFKFYHQYRVIREQLFLTTAMCFVAILVVSLIVISHPMAVMIIFGVVLMVFVDLLGCIPLMGLSLNSISMINMVMAIGLVVDYSMHIAHSFMAQDPSVLRNERAVLAMKEMGIPVVKGIFSTLVAILPLSLAGSEVFRVFFKMFMAILLVGGAHGLVLMPVVLSLVGPAAWKLDPPKIPQ
eukprot:gnl/TRDRNA2_/TRDRNA2_94111_c0_seq1.p1 gnl/TRDRNA2_/TRDRNA2_94111_c0~~gnl/TRDRNA2_/TRDRNA2_94111_c0_seq1.p1  ORF type:complete len:893 (-),score=185.54 gnl/TRDRNA2_/TRDRNA2_94111_c0_seq1:209-2551(-)